MVFILPLASFQPTTETPQYEAGVPLTEISNEICINDIRRPFPINNISIILNIEAEFLVTLQFVAPLTQSEVQCSAAQGQ